MRPSHLVAITRTDTAESRANAFAASCLVHDFVFGDVPGKDNMRPVAKPEIVPNPWAKSESISLRIVGGLITTPGVTTFITLGVKIPLGT